MEGLQGRGHPQRKEIARYLLSRGLDSLDAAEAGEIDPPDVVWAADARTTTGPPIAFPAGLEPQVQPLAPGADEQTPLPKADVVAITWTVDELSALARVLTPGVSPAAWQRYARGFDGYHDRIRRSAPASLAGRLGSYQPVVIGPHAVLCMKSELHLNQDGVRTGLGTATLPVKDFFKQIIAEARPSLVLTVGTAGAVYADMGLGDVVVTRAARFRCQNEFRNEPFNGQVFTSDWMVPTGQLDAVGTLMAAFADELLVPPFAPPTKRFHFDGPPIAAPVNHPSVWLDGRDMPAFHPILTTDYFEYGTSANRLSRDGAAVEMGDAALGLACSELDDPPAWAVVRNMSDPVINGDLPAHEFHLNEQTTWAVGYYTAYGRYTSLMSALTCWGIVAALPATGPQRPGPTQHAQARH